MLLSVRLASPVLVSVTICGSLATFVRWLPKLRVLGEKLVTGSDTEPIGASPVWRAVRTPAMTVDDTAPRPGRSTPNFPTAGAISRARGIRPLLRNPA